MINVLKNLFKLTPSSEYDSIISEIKKLYIHAQVDVGGGCSFQKALAMAAYIKEFKLQITVDIGVYRGRSLFPQAIAHKKYTNGIGYGIDPFDTEDAIQNDRPDLKGLLDKFIATTSFDQIYNDVINAINMHGLAHNCKIIRKKSCDAKSFFLENKLQPGLIHIDGNHDTFFVMQDVTDYFPLIKDGGIIVLDDISWSSVKPALDLLKTKCTFIGSIIDAQNDFAVFIKNGIANEIKIAEQVFNDIKKYHYK